MKAKFGFSLMIFVMLFICFSASADVWPVRRDWTLQDEQNFSRFIQNDFKPDIFTSPKSAFYGLATDCADAIYAARAIFAAKEGLPVLFSSTKKGQTFSQRTDAFDAYPESERLYKFLNSMADKVSTETLQTDTYPVRIDRKWMRPGVIFLSPKLSPTEHEITGFRGGHVEYVKRVSANGFLEFISSTSPRSVRELSLSRNPYLAPLVARGGFRLWKQPRWFDQPVSELPGYGEDQYELAEWEPLKLTSRRQIYLWHETVRRILRTRAPEFQERVDVVVNNICDLLRVRAQLVRQGWAQIAERGGQCLPASLTDQYSTETRDQRIRGAYLQLNDLYEWKNRQGESVEFGNIQDAKSQLQDCEIQYWSDRRMNAWDVFQIIRQNRLVSSADYSPAVRWGFSDQSGLRCR